LITVTIGNSVTSIGQGAFYGCNKLISVIFTPTSTLTSIGNNAFNGCTSLTSITVPITVITIDQGAFQSCTGLTSVYIANGTAALLGNKLIPPKTWTSTNSPGTLIQTPYFYNAPNAVRFIIPT